MWLRTLDEFELIARMTARLPRPGSQVLVGIGDDAAVLHTRPGQLLVLTTDAQVEDVHFRRAWMPPHALGYKALAVNVSDLAAMAAEPAFALVSLVLPEDLELSWLEALYAGLAEAAQAFHVDVVGGNMARSPGPVVVDIMLGGWAPRARLMQRHGARPGDRLLVTGELAAAAAGLWLLEHPQQARALPKHAPALISRFLRPEPRVAAAQRLARTGRVRAMLDLSDGLASDAAHLARAAGLGLEIELERLPLAAGVNEVAANAGRPAWHLALFGGEDYELALAADPQDVPVLQQALQPLSLPLTEVGRFLDADQGMWLRFPDGSRQPLFDAAGWRHFGRSA